MEASRYRFCRLGDTPHDLLPPRGVDGGIVNRRNEIDFRRHGRGPAIALYDHLNVSAPQKFRLWRGSPFFHCAMAKTHTSGDARCSGGGSLTLSSANKHSLA
jgi:hypothetical protein